MGFSPPPTGVLSHWLSVRVRRSVQAVQRVLIRKPGGYHRLELVEEPTPSPGPGQVVVATQGVGVNYADCVVRMGLYSSAARYVGWPITPGFEFAGTVAAVGDGVDSSTVGDRVFGVTRFGGYASHVVTQPRHLFPLPAEWSMPRGASFPTVHLTAWYALCELCRPRTGFRVLVHTAAGGVGLAALGICKRLGMEAVGVVGSSHKVDPALASGAVAVIDRSSQDTWAEARRLAPKGYDIVLESSGAATMKGSYRCLRPTGRLVVFGLASMLPKAGRPVRWWRLAYHYLRMPRFNPIRMIDRNLTVSAFNLSYLFEQQELLAEAMTQLLGWEREGALPAPPIATYPLAEVGRAHSDLESGQTVGKLVLVP
ncbi:MAG: zinc-binding dehydrogenase [Polyangiaceae bacterium]|nr:zinc-binding dehydrogenase [Polyangiaceae bacterium]